MDEESPDAVAASAQTRGASPTRLEQLAEPFPHRRRRKYVDEHRARDVRYRSSLSPPSPPPPRPCAASPPPPPAAASRSASPLNSRVVRIGRRRQGGGDGSPAAPADVHDAAQRLRALEAREAAQRRQLLALASQEGVEVRALALALRPCPPTSAGPPLWTEEGAEGAAPPLTSHGPTSNGSGGGEAARRRSPSPAERAAAETSAMLGAIRRRAERRDDELRRLRCERDTAWGEVKALQQELARLREVCEGARGKQEDVRSVGTGADVVPALEQRSVATQFGDAVTIPNEEKENSEGCRPRRPYHQHQQQQQQPPLEAQGATGFTRSHASRGRWPRPSAGRTCKEEEKEEDGVDSSCAAPAHDFDRPSARAEVEGQRCPPLRDHGCIACATRDASPLHSAAVGAGAAAAAAMTTMPTAVSATPPCVPQHITKATGEAQRWGRGRQVVICAAAAACVAACAVAASGGWWRVLPHISLAAPPSSALPGRHSHHQ